MRRRGDKGSCLGRRRRRKGREMLNGKEKFVLKKRGEAKEEGLHKKEVERE